MVAKPSSRKNLIASLAVWLLILLYIGLFSWQSVARHRAFATAAAMLVLGISLGIVQGASHARDLSKQRYLDSVSPPAMRR